MTLLNHLSYLVEQAVTLGSKSTCPKCGLVDTVKDSDLMRIKCGRLKDCQCSWCHACGQERRYDFCRQCDRTAPVVMESSPEESRWMLNGVCGHGDFQQRKTLYLLKQIKNKVPPSCWILIRRQCPRVLDLQTTGKRISLSWDDIDESTLPLYGLAKEEDIGWKHDMDGLIATLMACSCVAGGRADSPCVGNRYCGINDSAHCILPQWAQQDERQSHSHSRDRQERRVDFATHIWLATAVIVYAIVFTKFTGP